MRDKYTARAIRRYIITRTAWFVLLTALASITTGSYAYAAYLGDPLDQARPWSLYHYRYAYQLGGDYRLTWLTAATAPGVLIGFFGLGIVLAPKSRSDTHGDARWSSGLDQAKAGMRNDRGLILAKAIGTALRANKNTHLAMIAPTRSGKGLGVVIPNALMWYGSAIFTDIKLELWELTSGFRSTFSACYLFAPGRVQSMRYNPLDYVRRDRLHRMGDLQRLAHVLSPTPERADPMWSSEARSLFIAVVMFLMDADDAVVSLGNVHRVVNAQDWSSDGVKRLLAGHYNLDQYTIDTFTRVAAQGDKQRAGVTSSVMTALEVYADPLIDAATCTSDFDIREIRTRRMSIYLGAKENELKRLAPIFNLIVQQITGQLIDDRQAAVAGYPVMMMLDEFPALGRMDTVVDALGFLAGYDVRVVMIAQNIHQLGKVCNDPKELLASFNHTVWYAPALQEDAQALSVELGKRTVITESTSHSLSGTSKTRSESGKPLMTADQIKRLSHRKAIILQTNARPTIARKFNYLHDHGMRRLTKLPPVEVADLPFNHDGLATLWGEPLDEPLNVQDEIEQRFAA